MQLTYLLAESVITVAGKKVFVTDAYDGGVERPDLQATSATVVLGLRGDEGGGLRELSSNGRGQRDLTLHLTPDRRLTSVSYKSVGTGARVLAAGVKLLATVAGIGLRIAGVPAVPAGPATDGRESTPAPTPDAELTPEERAQRAWAEQNPWLVARREACLAVIHSAAEAELTQWWAGVADPTQLDVALARARRLAALADRSRAEVERIDALYRAWRSSTRTTREEAWTYTLSMAQLPGGSGPPEFGDQSLVVWNAVGIGVQIEPLGVSGSRTRGNVHESSVAWRIPRPVRLNVWQRAADPAAAPVLVSSTVTVVVDERCDVVELPLDSRHFGDDGLELEFGELGVPTTIGTARSSGVAAAAEALSGVPDHVAAGLASASTLQSAVTGLQDAAGERRLAGLKRRLETAQQELQLKAEAATAHDLVRLKRLQQQVAIAEAAGALEPATELEELTYELDLLKVRRELESLVAD